MNSVFIAIGQLIFVVAPIRVRRKFERGDNA